MPEPKNTGSLLPSYVNLAKLHENLLNDGYDLPDIKTFSKDMATGDNLTKLHENLIKDGYDLPDINTFSSDMGVKKKDTSTKSSEPLGSSFPLGEIKPPSLNVPTDNTNVSIPKPQPFAEKLNSTIGGRIAYTNIHDKPVTINGTEYNVDLPVKPVKASEYLQYKGASPIDVGITTQSDDFDLKSSGINMFNTKLEALKNQYLSPKVTDEQLQINDTDSEYVKKAKLIGIQTKTNRDASTFEKYAIGTPVAIGKGINDMVIKPIIGIADMITDLQALSTPQGMIEESLGVRKSMSQNIKESIGDKFFTKLDVLSAKSPDLPNTITGNVVGGFATLPGMIISFAGTPEVKAANMGLKMALNMGAVAFGNSYLESAKEPITDKLLNATKSGIEGSEQGLLMEGIMRAGSGSGALKSIAVNTVGFGGLNVYDQFKQTGDVDWHAAIGSALFGGFLGFGGGGEYKPEGIQILPKRMNDALTNYFTTPNEVARTSSMINVPVNILREQANKLRQEVIPDEKVNIIEKEDGTQSVKIDVDPETLSVEQVNKLSQAQTLDNHADFIAIDTYFGKNPEERQKAIETINADESLSPEQKQQQIDVINRSATNHDPKTIETNPIALDITDLKHKQEENNAEIEKVNESADLEEIKLSRKRIIEAKNKAIQDEIKAKEAQVDEIMAKPEIKHETVEQKPAVDVKPQEVKVEEKPIEEKPFKVPTEQIKPIKEVKPIENTVDNTVQPEKQSVPTKTNKKAKSTDKAKVLELKNLKDDKNRVVSELDNIEKTIIEDLSESTKKFITENGIDEYHKSIGGFDKNEIDLNRLRKKGVDVDDNGIATIKTPKGEFKFNVTDVNRIKQEVKSKYPTTLGKENRVSIKDSGARQRTYVNLKNKDGSFKTKEQVIKHVDDLIAVHENNIVEAKKDGNEKLVETFQKEIDNLQVYKNTAEHDTNILKENQNEYDKTVTEINKSNKPSRSTQAIDNQARSIKRKGKTVKSENEITKTVAEIDKVIDEIDNKIGESIPETNLDNSPKPENKTDARKIREDAIKQSMLERLGRIANIKELTGGEKNPYVEEFVGFVKELAELGEIQIEKGIEHVIKVLKENFDPKFHKYIDKYKTDVWGTLREDDPKYSGIKKALASDKAITDAQLEKISDKDIMSMGKEFNDSGQTKPEDLITKIVSSGEGVLTPKETVSLIAYKVDLDKRLDDAYKAHNDIFEIGSAEEIRQAKAEIDLLENKVLQYDMMSAITANQESLAFRLRKYLLSREYDLVTQKNKWKAHNKDGKISPEQEAKFEKMVNDLKQKEKELDEQITKNKEYEEKLAESNINEEILRESKVSLTNREKAKKLADQIRKGKLQRPDIFMSATPASLAWDGALEVVARTIEKGGEIADAVNRGLNHIKNTEWYRTHSNQKEIDKTFRDYFKEEKEKKPQVSKINDKGEIVISKQQLKDLIAQGKTTIREWTTEIHKELVKENPELTETQVRDAITGYGKRTNLTKDEVEIQILEQKGVGRLISALEEVVDKQKNPKRTGIEKRKLIEEERTLQKELREAMKKLPQSEGEELARWKSLLDKVKSQRRNEIESLDRQIEAGERDIKDKNGVEWDDETRDLTQIRDAKKAHLNSIDPIEKDISTEELINRAITKYDKQISELDKEIDNAKKTGDLSRNKKESVKTPQTEAIIERKKAIKERKAILEQMREESGMIEQERIKLITEKGIITIRDLKERIRTKNYARGRYNKMGEFIPSAGKKPMTYTQKIRKIRGEIFRLQEQFDKEQYANELQSRSKGKKVRDIIVETMALTRMIAGIDLSAFMIQGLIRTATRPTQASRSSAEMFKQLASPERYERFMSEIKHTDLYYEIKASGGYLSEPSSKFTAREEQYQSGWVNHVWDASMKYTVGLAGEKAYKVGRDLNPYNAGQRAFEGYLNMTRIQAYEEYFTALKQMGKTFENSPDDYKAVASWVNNATGRGKLIGSMDRAADIASIFLFSPRKVAANFNVINPRYYYKMYQRSPIMAKMAMKNMLQYVGVMGTTIALASLYGSMTGNQVINFDPTSSNFLKIQAGDKDIDILSGESQILVLLARMITGMRTSATGSEQELGLTKTNPTRFDVMIQFATGKASPTVGLGIRLLDGYRVKKDDPYLDPFGNEITLKSELLRNTVPIWMQSVGDLYNEGDPLTNSGLVFLSVLGANITAEDTKGNKEKMLRSLESQLNKPEINYDERQKDKDNTNKQALIRWYGSTHLVYDKKIKDLDSEELQNAVYDMKDEQIKLLDEKTKK